MTAIATRLQPSIEVHVDFVDADGLDATDAAAEFTADV